MFKARYGNYIKISGIVKLPVKSAILDGECIVFGLTQPKDQPPKYWWDDSMARFNTKIESEVKRIVTTLRARFPLWDILYLNGEPIIQKTRLKNSVLRVRVSIMRMLQ
ncbi:hypothetical protein JNUCC31_20640 [Paenibacillus sp. JNUCC31]|nr:hypothetical protein JNUCC31_20640 [Paenibacillus sp. JNUCC-31]